MTPFLAWLPYVISVANIGVTILQGNKHRQAWLASMGMQALWLTWIISTRNWGFLPLNAAFWIISIRNHIRWSVG